MGRTTIAHQQTQRMFDIRNPQLKQTVERFLTRLVLLFSKSTHKPFESGAEEESDLSADKTENTCIGK